MNSYKRITFPENKRRQAKLMDFRRAVVQYFDDSEFHWISDERSEGLEAQEARTSINLMMHEVGEIIQAALVNSFLIWTDAPAAGGRQARLDLVQNVFLLSQHSVSPELLLDKIDQAIGVYQASQRSALIRTLNPFHYLGLVLDFVVSLPFQMLGSAGFDRARAEHSLIGRLAKVSGYLIITVPASILTAIQILKELELLDQVKAMVIG